MTTMGRKRGNKGRPLTRFESYVYEWCDREAKTLTNLAEELDVSYVTIAGGLGNRKRMGFLLTEEVCRHISLTARQTKEVLEDWVMLSYGSGHWKEPFEYLWSFLDGDQRRKALARLVKMERERAQSRSR